MSKFELGQVVATPGALEALQRNGQMALQFISRHVQGEWGELSDEDSYANDMALVHDTRILSAYSLNDGTKIWIISEADRSVTTLLTPEEY